MADRDSSREGNDPARGAAIEVGCSAGEVTLELGVMRNFGSLSTDAWAALSPDEARDLASDLLNAADRAEREKAADV